MLKEKTKGSWERIWWIGSCVLFSFNVALVLRNSEFNLIKVVALCLVAEKSERKWKKFCKYLLVSFWVKKKKKFNALKDKNQTCSLYVCWERYREHQWDLRKYFILVFYAVLVLRDGELSSIKVLALCLVAEKMKVKSVCFLFYV